MIRQRMIKQWNVVFLAMALLCIMNGNVFAKNQEKKSNYKIERMIADLQVCQDRKLGVFFLCHENWKIQVVDDAVLMIIADDPDVTLIVAQIESSIKFLGQLTRKQLKGKNRYADGFRIEKVHVGKDVAIKVKGYAIGNPKKRLLDHYLIHNKILYGVLFSVTPKTDFGEYKFLFKKVIENFGFLNDKGTEGLEKK